MTEQRLRELFDRFGSLKIVLIGDLFLDRWYEIDPEKDEPSLETGRTAHQVVKKRSAPGAGGTVLNNLAAMGIGQVRVISVIGKDGDGWELLNLLKERGIGTESVIESTLRVTPSYIKPLFPEEGERLDIKNFTPLPEELEERVIGKLRQEAKDADAVILLDQVCEPDCGVLTERVRYAAAKIAGEHPKVLFLADSRAFIDRFRGVVIKCNNYEAAGLLGRSTEEDEPFSKEQVFRDMDELERKTGHPAVITCNRHGIAVRSGEEQILVPAAKHRGPIDICGAGDAATAGFTAAVCAGASMEEAARIACLSSGVTVRKLGTTGTASREEMLLLFREAEE